MSDIEWQNYQTDTLAKISDRSLKAATEQRFNQTNAVYTRAMKELNKTIIALNKKPGNNRLIDSGGVPIEDANQIKQQNSDAELEAYNRLYEHYLRQVQDILPKLEELRTHREQNSDQLNPNEESQLNELTLKFHEVQSKALFFANEAYHTRQAAMHVVLGQQLKLGIKLSIDEYLVSINEQMGFAMEQISEKKGRGTSLWKSAKYIDRVSDAITKIQQIRKKQELPELFTPETVQKIEKIKATSTELLNIKKGKGDYYNTSLETKNDEAVSVAAEGYGFNIGTIDAIRQEFLKFNIEINTQLRNASPNQYKSPTSELNNWPEYKPPEDLYAVPDEQSQVAPERLDELAKKTFVETWKVEDLA